MRRWEYKTIHAYYKYDIISYKKKEEKKRKNTSQTIKLSMSADTKWPVVAAQRHVHLN